MSAPRWIVAVDPGLNGCGVSIFDESSKLIRADYVRNEVGVAADMPARWEGAAVSVGAWLATARYELASGVKLPSTLFVEMPRIYPSARQVGDQNDLVNLAGVVAALTLLGAAENRRLFFPRDWKGTLNPEAMIERIQGRLTPAEHRAVSLPTAASLQHNVWDAIGIGLHAIGRLEPRKVIPR